MDNFTVKIILIFAITLLLMSCSANYYKRGDMGAYTTDAVGDQTER